MADKRETRKDLPKREHDSDLNSPALSNTDDPAVDQRDSDGRGGQASGGKDTRSDTAKRDKKEDAGKEHDVGGADNLSR